MQYIGKANIYIHRYTLLGVQLLLLVHIVIKSTTLRRMMLKRSSRNTVTAVLTLKLLMYVLLAMLRATSIMGPVLLN